MNFHRHCLNRVGKLPFFCTILLLSGWLAVGGGGGGRGGGIGGCGAHGGGGGGGGSWSWRRLERRRGKEEERRGEKVKMNRLLSQSVVHTFYWHCVSTDWQCRCVRLVVWYEIICTLNERTNQRKNKRVLQLSVHLQRGTVMY